MSDFKQSLLSNIVEPKLEELAKFESSFFNWPWTKESWLGLASSGREISCIWAADDEIQGICVFEVNAPDFCHLYKIIVHPDFRRRSIAKKLFEAMLSHCQKTFNGQIFQIYLEVEASNEGAIRFYETLGLEKIHLKKNFYADGGNAVIMHRVVN
ncbi:FR47-like protein [Bacteriovorax sp. BAL6_X]|uniref:GNAT family N-acetyltransferase n=1 Tax=Bacteriovorax sp. BAL6_X TaxID=1201290 RepID=UPI00038626A0|nr:N-acetyltransferase [Bacteriovorax sp. BAL6_X]EPZ50726.1 FR47-like protein [Bacteriovorax sp. BAL6_X]